MITTAAAPLTGLRTLGATTDLVTAARFHGIGRQHAYALNLSGQLPFPTHRIGERWSVRTSELARSLGIDPRWLLADDEPAPEA